MKVQCSKCGEEYHLRPDENPSDFQCKCGGELIKTNGPPYNPESPEDEGETDPEASNNTYDDLEKKPPVASNDDREKKKSKSIFDDWKKQYMIVIAVVFLVFIIIAVDSAFFFGDLVVTNVTAPSTALKGQEIIIPNTIKNDGILPTGDCNVTFQFTPEQNSKNIIFLGKLRISDLASGASVTQDTKFTVPQNITPGRYYIRVVVDSNKEIYEANENNNEIYSSTQVNII
ncbi:hypothetical protein BK009_06210 [Methanobacterium subterraneum]|uniref:CARDB domain-containing protein n=1 Tax=Methanobacterium subterraneum TaxID=59277 RepID=A0A2H4VQE6_9EURY|nr:CARDB domain-containing protein [Methanobacterium subterraneum]AUB60315.1 hypothetical protein BK009_06210 [Methanobacterium subterraneum]